VGMEDVVRWGGLEAGGTCEALRKENGQIVGPNKKETD